MALSFNLFLKISFVETKKNPIQKIIKITSELQSYNLTLPKQNCKTAIHDTSLHYIIYPERVKIIFNKKIFTTNIKN